MTTTPRFAQVGGHDQTVKPMSDDSSIVNKPANASELAWYTTLGPRVHSTLIGDWTPQFYGTLTLQGKVDDDGNVIAPVNASADTSFVQGSDAQAAISKAPPQLIGLDSYHSSAPLTSPMKMIVLENLTYRFNRPNVLDIKLGTQLYDENASDEKRARMEQAAKDTTSYETGVRLTGFQVWDPVSQQFHTTPKAFGKSLAVSDLEAGFSHYFDPSSSKFPPSLSNASSNPPTLPRQLYVPVMTSIVKRLQQFQELLQQVEVRVRGSSLLIVIEGDPDTLKQTLERLNAKSPSSSANHARCQSPEQERGEEEDDEESELEDEQGNVKPSALIPFEVKWIDFAHARLAPGEGVDGGLILGVKSTIQHLQTIVDRLDKE
ncbi:hypothetical protein OIO90_001710 [Microbotryomycetes sp. JL221]|nr:hypothetical protein OIO90_001710 [Microbotryomycetes sp. JL221]